MSKSFARGGVLSHDDMMALSDKLLEMTSRDNVGVLIEHTARSVVKVTNERVLSSHEGDEVSIHFTSQFGGGLPVSIGTNQINPVSLKRVVDQALSIRPKPAAGEKKEISNWPGAPELTMFAPRSFTPVSLWHNSTVEALTAVRKEAAPHMLNELRKSDLKGTATLGVSVRAALYRYRHGLTAWVEETDGEVSATARTPDGKASGWSGQANRDWAKMNANAVVTNAIDMANRSRNIVAFEPGRRTAILGPAAVAQLLAKMPGMFSAYSTDELGPLPFSLRNEGRSRKNKINRRVVDPRLNLVSDPADPDGGFPPFFEAGGTGMPGLPLSRVNWIEEGVLKNLAYIPYYAGQRGKMWSEQPYSVKLSAVPDTQLQTVEEMISNCRDGIYVNRFSNISVVDSSSGLMSGVTRDGCFLVRNGKIDKPIKNFRFLESPLFILNKLIAIGKSERAAFGYSPIARSWSGFGSWPPNGRDARWPLAPVVAPPVMVADFNFSSLSEAV